VTAVRSLLFAVLALTWTALLTIVYLPLLALPRRIVQRAAALWSRGVLGLLAATCGLRHRVVGFERLPAGPAIIAAKHQSAWDTVIFHRLFDDPVYVLKGELLAVPLFGWYLRKTGNIAIDRAAGVRAIRTMLPAARRLAAEGARIVVFPEGTRVPPGGRRRYNPGIAALYQQVPVPVVPVALNSGLFWGRRGFLKRPGVITLEFLEPMPSGLNRDGFLAELERRIERATARLLADARPPGDRDERADPAAAR
jgi:1-acyl-sn-glycerol-3-phosphate acyltransferase